MSRGLVQTYSLASASSRFDRLRPPTVSASRRGTPRVLRISPIDAVQHVSELRSRDRDDTGSDGRPDPVMPENFYQRAAAPAKHVEIAGMRVALEPLLH